MSMRLRETAGVIAGKAVGRLSRITPGLGWWLYRLHARIFGEVELAMVRCLCRRDRASFDIGANRGIYAARMWRHSKSVIAFEPNPDCAAFMERHLGTRVRVEACALADESGTVELMIPVAGEGFAMDGLGTLSPYAVREFARLQRVTVPVHRLDDYADIAVGFIKIDVEGAEMAVLRGGRGLLERWRPRLLIECEERHAPNALGEVRDFLGQLGYAAWFVLNGRLAPIDAFVPRLHQRIEDIGRPGVYINNFLFLLSGDRLDN